MENKLTPLEKQAEGQPYDDYIKATAVYYDERVFDPLIFDLEVYGSIVKKPSVRMIDQVPQLVSLEDSSDFINSERAKIITGKIAEDAAVYVATVPVFMLANNLHHLMPPAQQEGGIVILAEIDLVEEGIEDKLASLVAMQGFSLHALKHPRIDTEAALNMFEIDIEQNATPAQPRLSISEVVKTGIMPSRQPVEDGEIISTSGDNLSEADTKQLWELFSTRFNDISDNLPQRLEETEEDTKTILSDPHNIIFFKTDLAGQIMAAILATDNPDSYPWINPRFQEMSDIKTADRYGIAPYSVFAPGVASRGEQAARSAHQVMSAMTQTLSLTNQPLISVRFECTDVSSKYIPAVSMRAVKGQQGFEDSSISQIAQKKYLALYRPA
jgi:hypothetical protein